MAASVRLVQFRKIFGESDVTVVEMQEALVDTGWGFFGNHAPGPGYVSPPSSSNAAKYPIRGGAASWEVWLGVEVTGASFQIVTDIHFALETYENAGLGRFVSPTNGYRIQPKESILTLSGLYMRAVQGPIELQIDPDPALFVPIGAPAVGLPYDGENEGWLLFEEHGGNDYVFPGDASDTNPPTAIDIGPMNVYLPPSGGDPHGRGIVVTDIEPRFSNLAVLNFCVAGNATGSHVYNPVEMTLTWNES